MLIVAVTGGIGSGKSTVVDLFRHKGVPIIDTDVISRKIVQDHKIIVQLADTFGKDILNQDGTLDRARLRNVAFASDENRIKLGKMLHPLIYEQAMEQIAKISAPYCLLVIPLLYESSHQYQYDRVLVIDIDERTQLQRAMQRDQASKTNIQKIIAAQASRQQRLSIADDVIDNSGDITQLAPQVDALHKTYLELAEHTLSG